MTGTSKRKLLGVDAIERGLKEVADIAARDNIQVLLVGGVALQYYGSMRLTVDLDVVALVSLPTGLPNEGPLAIGGTKTHLPGGTPLDWIVPGEDYAGVFEEALLYGRRIETVPIPVASPEYLAAMKMIAGRSKDDLDLIELLQSGEVDVQKARRMIRRLLGVYAAQDFGARVTEAEWRAHRDGEE